MISRESLARFGDRPPAEAKPDSNETGFDLDAYLLRHNLKVMRRKPWPAHPSALIFELIHCPFNTDHINGSSAFTLLEGKPGFACQHTGCHDRTINDVFAKFPPEPQSRVEVIDNWPEPLPLQSELPPVEPFQLEFLPKCMRRLVQDVSERMQAPPDFACAATVLGLAGAVGRRALIQPKCEDTQWKVTPNLWGGIIARPGFMKTPVIQAVMEPLRSIQATWFDKHKLAIAEHGRDKELHALEVSVWKEEFKRATKDGKPTPERPTDLPSAPTAERLIVADATFEKLHEVMETNPAGVLVLRDELTGWLAQLDKPGRETERSFCLEAWNGDGAFTVERVSRGLVHVDHICMSLFGGIQPGRLRGYLAEALRDGPGDDGLIQRFQVLVWPDLPPGWQLIDRKPDEAAANTAKEVFARLVELTPDNPLLFRFLPTAQELFFDWYSDLQNKIRNANLHPALASHLSKYAKLMPALALLFELADQVSSQDWQLGSVNLDHARQSAGYCSCLESHARRIYSCVTSPEMRAGAELADHIRRGDLGGQSGIFSLRDVYRPQWAGLGTPDLAAAAVRVLGDWDWIRQLKQESGPTGGRTPTLYLINPKARRAK